MVWVCACVYVHTCVKVHVCMWVSACGGLKLTSVIPPLGRVSWWTRKSLLANQLSSVNLLSPWAWYLQNEPPCVCKSEPAISSGKPNFYVGAGIQTLAFTFEWQGLCVLNHSHSTDTNGLDPCVQLRQSEFCDWFKHKWHSCVFILKCFTIISSSLLSSFVYTCACLFMCVCMYVCSMFKK